MSAINSIAATQPSIPATSRKFTAQQTAATPPQPAANTSSATISQAARDLAALPTTDPSLHFRAVVLRDAQSDPVFAKKMAEQFANNDSYEKHGPMVNITVNPIRYSFTGEVVTDKNLAEFKAEAEKVTTGRIALYQAEKAKGTPDVQILEKLFTYVDGQSDNYLSKLNWTRPPQQNVVEKTGQPITQA